MIYGRGSNHHRKSGPARIRSKVMYITNGILCWEPSIFVN